MNLQDLDNLIKKSQVPVLFEFWGSWCLPCQMMISIFEELKNDFGDKIKIVKINIDLNQAISARYNIRGLPTLILYNGKKELFREVGAKSKNEIYSLINKYVGNE